MSPVVSAVIANGCPGIVGGTVVEWQCDRKCVAKFVNLLLLSLSVCVTLLCSCPNLTVDSLDGSVGGVWAALSNCSLLGNCDLMRLMHLTVSLVSDGVCTLIEKARYLLLVMLRRGMFGGRHSTLLGLSIYLRAGLKCLSSPSLMLVWNVAGVRGLASTR